MCLTWLPTTICCRLHGILALALLRVLTLTLLRVLALSSCCCCCLVAFLQPGGVQIALRQPGAEAALGLVLGDDAAHTQQVTAGPAVALLCIVVILSQASFLFDGCPTVLDCVVCAATNLLGYEGPLVAMLLVALDQLRILLHKKESKVSKA